MRKRVLNKLAECRHSKLSINPEFVRTDCFRTQLELLCNSADFLPMEQPMKNIQFPLGEAMMRWSLLDMNQA